MALDFGFQTRTTGTGGINTTVVRSNQQVAPEVIQLRHTATGSIGSLPKGHIDYSDNDTFDPQFSEVFYKTDWGDGTATFDYVENLPAIKNNSNVSYGPIVAHLYRTTGTYTVTVTATNPALRRSVSTTFQITVGDDDALFAGTKTHFVNTSGDNTNAPSGALTYTSMSAAIIAVKAESTPQRLMPDWGETFDTGQVRVNSTTPTLHIRPPKTGSGAMPFFAIPTGVDDAANNIALFDIDDHGSGNDLVIMGIKVDGTWDSATETGYDGGMFIKGFDTPSEYLAVVDCEATDCRNFYHTSGSTGHANTKAFFVNNMCRDLRDMTIADYANFNGAASYRAYVGNRFMHEPDAISDGSKADNPASNIHGIVRSAEGGTDCFHQNDFFTQSGWSVLPPYKAIQPNIRYNTGEAAGAYCSIVDNAFEAGNNVLEMGPASEGDTTNPINCLIEGNLLVGNHQTKYFITIASGGYTICNNLCIRPNCTSIAGGGDLAKFVETVKFNGITTAARNAPTRYFNNTVVNLLTAANAVGDGEIDGIGLVIGSGVNFNYDEFDNVYHEPGVSNTADAPFTVATILGASGSAITPRATTGYKENDGSIVAGTATPSDTVRSYVPATGSAAIGDASGPFYTPWDFNKTTRSSTPSRGAFEPA